MRKLLTAAISSVAILALTAGAALANDCYLPNKPIGAGAFDDGRGAFRTFDLGSLGTFDFFDPPASGNGHDDEAFGKALPEGARNSGPGDGCGYGVDSFEVCVLGG